MPQFRVSILWKNYEERSSLKIQLKIEFFLLYTCSTKVLENIPGIYGKRAGQRSVESRGSSQILRFPPTGNVKTTV